MTGYNNGLFPKSDKPADILDYLNSSSFDELVEVDLENDNCRNIHHVNGKYYVPFVNGTYFDIFRYCVEHMIHPEDAGEYRRLMSPDLLRSKFNGTDKTDQAEFRYKLENGGWCWVRQIVIGGPGFGLADGTVHCYIFDISSKKDRETGDSKASPSSVGARYNELTGLMPTDDFFLKAKGIVSGQVDKKWCVVSIDLEHFKLFNEWYGRSTGDRLLADMGKLLSDNDKSTSGISCYIGQDDFAVLMPYDEGNINRLFADMRSVMGKYSDSIGFLPAVGVSMADDPDGIAEAYDHAAQAAQYAKGNYRQRIRVFRPEMYERTEREYTLLSEFQDAVRENEITFFLQPQCRASTKRVVGAEALARWIKKDGTVVSPGEFIPILEKYGFISDLDEFIWEGACKWQSNRIKNGRSPLPVSVNVSQIDILTMDVPAHFASLIKKYELPASAIKVEITESAYAENTEAVMDTVKRLQDNGFLVLMDDFGSGYSALNMLRSLRVDILKVDAHFLRMDSTDERKGVQIIESVLNMTKNMGLPVIFEGVETEEQTNFLKNIGCRYIQGYYFYKPMSIKDFEKLIENDDNVDDGGFVFKANEQFRMREFMDENIYSDAMLNGILGPVAIYSEKDGKVNIIRFNEQFYEEVGLPEAPTAGIDIVPYLPESSRKKIYELMRAAEFDHINGSVGTVQFFSDKKGFRSFSMRLYYLGEDSGAKKFYGAARDITEYARLRDSVELIFDKTSECVVFVSHKNDGFYYELFLHGDKEIFGEDADELTSALKDKSFYTRVSEEDRAGLLALTRDFLDGKADFSAQFRLRDSNCEYRSMAISAYVANAGEKENDYILIMKKA